MFTGIIKATARVKSVKADKHRRAALLVERPRRWQVKKGESIAVNGACLTVVGLDGGLHFAYMPETAARSAVGGLKPGEIVNLERPLRFGDRLDGHIVEGHVDTVGTVSSLKREGNSQILKITPRDPQMLRWIVEKGSVAVDGISLTVIKTADKWFTVGILPYTWKHTNLHAKRTESLVNLEVDVLAKYAEKLYANKK